MAKHGFILAAPTSGAGKTTITLGLLRAFHKAGVSIAGAKSGPDYIDPAYHTAATGKAAFNLDAWSMPDNMLRSLAAGSNAELLLIEGAMGVLDGAGIAGNGSVADLAQTLDLPVILIIDAAKQSHSMPLTPIGLKALRPQLNLAGVILNNIGSARHLDMARGAVTAHGIDVLGAVPRMDTLKLPARHLGLLQAREHDDLVEFLDQAGAVLSASCNLDSLIDLALPIPPAHTYQNLPPLGQRISIAQDDAFSFIYPHMLESWGTAGAELHFFSPLADETPAINADAIFLPGGYPELYAGQLSGASQFRAAMRQAAGNSTLIYGECGGFMTLGDTLIDGDGNTHAMLGLLPLTTSFAKRKLTLGYRKLRTLPEAPFQGVWRAHEFHYATISNEGTAERLFDAEDADGNALAPMGLRRGRISGSFAHLIAPGA